VSIVGNDGAYLGKILLFVRTPEAAETGTGEIAYVVAPAARGRGIATEAVRLLAVGACRSRSPAAAVLSIRPGNVSSIRVAEEAGYRLEGTLRSVKVIRGKRVDVSLYCLFPEDVAAGASRQETRLKVGITSKGRTRRTVGAVPSTRGGALEPSGAARSPTEVKPLTKRASQRRRIWSRGMRRQAADRRTFIAACPALASAAEEEGRSLRRACRLTNRSGIRARIRGTIAGCPCPAYVPRLLPGRSAM
jgi:hypothetical protein